MQAYTARAYRIYWDDCDAFYVGSTKQRLCDRMKCHRAKCKPGRTYSSNSKLYTFMRSQMDAGKKFRYEEIESREVEDMTEQRKFEREIWDRLGPTLNTERPHVTAEEIKADAARRQANKTPEQKAEEAARSAAWRAANPEKMKAGKDRHYQENKAEVLAKCADYYQANKERVKARVKAYADANKEKIKERGRAYHKANRAAIKAKKAARYAALPVVECGCGASLKGYISAQHKRTRRHTAWAAEQAAEQ